MRDRDVVRSAKLFGVPVGDCDGPRMRCSDHPAGEVARDECGVVRCREPGCSAYSRECGRSLGTKSCVLPEGHGGPAHVSQSGTSWPDAASPPPVGPPITHAWTSMVARDRGVSGSVDFHVAPGRDWVDALSPRVADRGAAVYSCAAWIDRVRRLVLGAAEPVARFGRSRGARGWPKQWVARLAFWARDDGAAVVRMEPAGGARVVYAVVPPGLAGVGVCGSCCDECRAAAAAMACVRRGGVAE